MKKFKYIPPKMGLMPNGRLLPGGKVDLKSAPGFNNDVRRIWRKKTKARRFYGVDLGNYVSPQDNMHTFSHLGLPLANFASETPKKPDPPPDKEKSYLVDIEALILQEKALTPEQQAKLRLLQLKKQEEFEQLKETRRDARTAIEATSRLTSLSREIRGWTNIFAGIKA